jgi:hypothetical protein
MPINSFLYPGAKFTPPYQVTNSIRFDDGSSDNLTRSQTSGNRRTWTFSTWVKRCTTGSSQGLANANTTDDDRIQFHSSDVFRVYFNGAASAFLVTNRLFRDVSAWYHIVVAVDTTQGTASNRIKLYVNGVQETSFSTETYPSQDYDTFFNVSNTLHVGSSGAAEYMDGYLAETVFIDGSQLDPTSFGETDEDTGIWKPIDVSGLTFGTNGFYLDFEDSSALGDDVSGNNNDFTVNNLTSVDQSTDTCTNNFATWNGIKPLTRGALSEGNLVFTGVSGAETTYSSIGASSGKWYFEVKGTTNGDRMSVGCAQKFVQGDQHQQTTNTNGIGYDGVTGSLYVNNSDVATYSTYSNNDIIGVALDLDNRKIYFSVNGTWQNSADPSAGSNGYSLPSNLSDEDFWFFAVSDTYGSGATVWSANFGSPQFSISSGNSDPNGYGNFEYGTENFYALNTKNLAEYG